ncbi:MAG: hypothetical protein WA908_06620 [Pontixanthobacter sp.]
MTYRFGKIIAGGREVSAQELLDLPKEHLLDLRKQYRALAPSKHTSDVIDLRLSEELETAERTLENVEQQLDGATPKSQLKKQVDIAEKLVGDVADIVGADDRCEEIANADPDLKRRLLRRTMDGGAVPCDNRA